MGDGDDLLVLDLVFQCEYDGEVLGGTCIFFLGHGHQAFGHAQVHVVEER
jgi:hypothetical protein